MEKRRKNLQERPSRILHLLPYGSEIGEEIRKGVARRRFVAGKVFAVEAEGSATGTHHGRGLHCLTPLLRGPCHHTAAARSWTPSHILAHINLRVTPVLMKTPPCGQLQGLELFEAGLFLSFKCQMALKCIAFHEISLKFH